MMVPNQIKMQTFTSSGRGAYKASEVDDFLEYIYQNYCEVYADNSRLKKKFSSLSEIIVEYNSNKNSIATAMINAQALSDQTVKNAENAANELIEKAKKETEEIIKSRTMHADQYLKEKTEKADSYLKNAESEAEKYIESINLKAKKIIDDANEKARKIIDDAYADTKDVQQKTDELITNANEEYTELRNELFKFKNETTKLLDSISKSLDSIDLPDDLKIETSLEKTATDEKNEEEPAISEFSPKLDDDEIKADESDESKDAETPQDSESIPNMDSYVNEIFESVKFGDNTDFISSAANKRREQQTDLPDIFSKSDDNNDYEEKPHNKK